MWVGHFASQGVSGDLGGAIYEGMRLEGKAALVTGSSRGIGRAIALRFAADGADVVVHYRRNEADAHEVAAGVRAAGRRAAVVQADLGRIAEARRLVGDAVARLGQLDILVNNAAIEKRAPFWEVTEEDWDAVVTVDLKAAFFVAQEMTRHLRASGRAGRIINIGSVHNETPLPGFAAYCASKGGLQMLTRTMAVELAGTDITVNGIAPGAIETEINRDVWTDPARRAALTSKIPLRRMGQPSDVAAVAAFLASADADYVSGSTYGVDGGLRWSYEE